MGCPTRCRRHRRRDGGRTRRRATLNGFWREAWTYDLDSEGSASDVLAHSGRAVRDASVDEQDALPHPISSEPRQARPLRNVHHRVFVQNEPTRAFNKGILLVPSRRMDAPSSTFQPVWAVLSADGNGIALVGSWASGSVERRLAIGSVVGIPAAVRAVYLTIGADHLSDHALARPDAPRLLPVIAGGAVVALAAGLPHRGLAGAGGRSARSSGCEPGARCVFARFGMGSRTSRFGVVAFGMMPRGSCS